MCVFSAYRTPMRRLLLPSPCWLPTVLPPSEHVNNTPMKRSHRAITKLNTYHTHARTHARAISKHCYYSRMLLFIPSVLYENSYQTSNAIMSASVGLVNRLYNHWLYFLNCIATCGYFQCSSLLNVNVISAPRL